MCGRFVLDPTPKFFERFQAQNQLPQLEPRFNIAPGQNVPIIVRRSPNQAVLMRWGLVPHWAKDEKIGYKMINARAETLAQKPSFKYLIKSKRCLVPSSGFYEWQKTQQEKIPYFIKLKNEKLFSFAGLYDVWKNSQGKEIETFTIITTDANKKVAAIHNRMPVILKEQDEDLWLDKKISDLSQLLKVLKPFDDQAMETYQVSKAVNKATIDDKSLVKPLGPMKLKRKDLATLFNR